MNIFTGVFVESALKSVKDDQDYLMIKNIRELVETVAHGQHRCDSPMHEPTIDWDKFQDLLQMPQMRAYLKAIDIDPSEALGLFQLLDLDKSGIFAPDEFM